MSNGGGIGMTWRATPVAPMKAGQFRLFIDEMDGRPKLLDSLGQVQNLAATGDMSDQDADNVDISGGRLRATDGLGYGSSASASVTQLSNKGTAVTANGYIGQITMSSASLAANTTISFTFNNDKVGVNDQILMSHHSVGSFGSYNINARVTGAGTASISVRNVTAGSLSEAIILNYLVVKGE